MILKWLYRESVWFTGACLIYCILAFWAVWSENYILMLLPLGAAAAIFFLKMCAFHLCYSVEAFRFHSISWE